MNKNIPFTKPDIGNKEKLAVEKALASNHLSGGGEFSSKSEELLKGLIGSKKVLLTSSCTHALEISAILLDLKEGDEVIVPSFTFVSTASAFLMHGAKIRFADIKEEDLNLDTHKLGNLVNDKTRAIVPINYGGVSADYAKIRNTIKNTDIKIIEDNAHGIGALNEGIPLGSQGDTSCLSFHVTKNITSGEGGAICINDHELLDRAEIIRDKGTNRNKFLLGEVDRYKWIDKGSNYLMSEINASMLYEQLKRLESINKNRAVIWHTYHDSLANISQEKNIQIHKLNPESSSSYHIFYLIMPSSKMAIDLITFMKSNNIDCTFHYQPLHSSPYMQLQGNKDECDVAERISQRIVRLPIYSRMKKKDTKRVIDCFIKFLD
jgi:dTDP-4-amino-4,6-dideoxygalactose transaminase